ncbi:hypothetical protein, partial [Nocardioides sp. Soil796]
MTSLTASRSARSRSIAVAAATSMNRIPVLLTEFPHKDAGIQGEFNRSSQHLMITEVFDGSS